jgi:hypothetical protein
MKIGIIGAGTASAVALLKIFETIHDKKLQNIEISCIYDPNVPITHVGESTSPALSFLLYRVLNFCVPEDINKFDGTLRWGTRYYWDDANRNTFFINHGNPGLHVNSEKFSLYIIEKLSQVYNLKKIHDNITIVNQSVSSVTVVGTNNTYIFDYLIDCRGTPTKEELASDDYSISDFLSVNSVILYPDFQNYHEDFTSAYVHNNGWMFGVPLQHRKAFGYLYNNNITTQEEAIHDFEKIKNIDASKLRKFSWTPYYKNKAVEGRILYLGNKLYFFEPAQALPLHYYIVLTNNFFTTIISEKYANVENYINNKHIIQINLIQELIAVNYVGENNINSKFWEYAKQYSFLKLKDSFNFTNWCKRAVLTNTISEYWKHDEQIMNQYVNGFKIDLTKFLN